MATIIHMMGNTCAGKTTLIEQMLGMSDKVGAVQIGKMLRAKYGEDYFKGQAAPSHTRIEAAKMYTEGVHQALEDGKKVILVDGQPRDLSQIDMTLESSDSRFLLVHASHEVREERAKATRAPGPDLDLALARLNNDYRGSYEVMVALMRRGVTPWSVDTGVPGFDSKIYCKTMLISCGVSL